MAHINILRVLGCIFLGSLGAPFQEVIWGIYLDDRGT